MFVRKKNMSEWTTIRILKTTRDALAPLGVKGETYDEIILRLLSQKNGE